MHYLRTALKLNLLNFEQSLKVLTPICSYEEFLLHLGKDHYMDELKTFHKETSPQCKECEKMMTDDSKLIGHLVTF